MENSMKIGPHISPQETPPATLDYAKQCGYSVFQTGWMSMHSSNLPDSILGIPAKNYPRIYDLKFDPTWVLHSAYVVHCSPKNHGVAYLNSKYLRTLFQHAQAIGSTIIVVHTGATKEKTPKEVVENMRHFLQHYGIIRALQEVNETFPLTLAVENVAAAYDFNKDLNHMLSAIEGLPHVGWCLDLAHRFAAGVTDANISEVIEHQPPSLVHANFPGSRFGSGLDRHGWRYQQRDNPSPFVNAEQMNFWDGLIGHLNEKKIPMILEGGSLAGDMGEELEIMKKLQFQKQ